MGSLPVRIGILLASSVGNKASALKYLILYQNLIQSSFEFQFLPLPEDTAFLKKFESTKPIDRKSVVDEMPDFLKSYEDWSRQNAERYNLIPEKVDGFVILSKARFSDKYYLTSHDNWAIIALGYWKRYMAPPSIFEFFLNLLIVVAIDFACGKNFPLRHYTTKGCIFDFTASLADERLNILTGFVCSTCVETMKKTHNDQLLHDVKLILSKKWLGDTSQPSDVSTITKKLGYDLFHTKGVKQTFLERLQEILEKEVVKTILMIVGTLVIAIILVWLGLKSQN